MSISGDYPEIEDLFLLKEPISEVTIAHPLWHGLEVTVVRPKDNSLQAKIVKIFYELHRTKIGDGCYVNPSEKGFIHLWEQYKASGKSITAFQIDLLKAQTKETPVEAKIAAALSLSDLNEGEGYVDEEVAIFRGWRGSADKIAVLHLDQFQPIGEGGFGVVSGGTGFIADSKRKIFLSKSFALKNPKDETASACFEKGNALLSELWEAFPDYEGLVKPSLPMRLLDDKGNYVTHYAMTGYDGDLWRWSQDNGDNVLGALQGYLVALKGLAFLQTHRVMHIDLKPENILFITRNDEICFEINDFDASFALLPFDDKSKWTKENKAKFLISLKRIIIPYSLSYTIYEERLDFGYHLMALRELLSLSPDEEDWDENFSAVLESADAILKTIQIRQMGWTLLAVLTDSSPRHFYTDSIEPAISHYGVTLVSGDIAKAKETYLRCYETEKVKIKEAIGSLSLSDDGKERLVELITKMIHPSSRERPSLSAVQKEISCVLDNTTRAKTTLAKLR